MSCVLLAKLYSHVLKVTENIAYGWQKWAEVGRYVHTMH